LEKDGVTIVNPGAESATCQALAIDDADAGAEVSAETQDAIRKTMPPRVATPARPKTRRGDSDEHQSPRPRTPSAQDQASSEESQSETADGRSSRRPSTSDRSKRVAGTPRPRTPAVRGELEQAAADDDVMVASPGRREPAAEARSPDTTNSNAEAEVIEMACESPLGNTGAAKDLCTLAIAAAVDMAFGGQQTHAEADDKAGCGTRETAPAKHAARRPLEKKKRVPAGALDSSSSTSSSSSSGGTAELCNTATFGNTLSNTLGNTGGATRLCDEAIAAAVGSAVNEIVLNGSSELLDDIEGEGSPMSQGGADGALGCSMARTGGTMRGTLGNSMRRTFGGTLGATGDIPPVAPGEGLPGDSPTATTPRPQEHLALLGGVLGSDDEDDEEGEPLSPTLISICRPSSASPTKRDLSASFDDSPSIVILEDTQWTPCKALPRPSSPVAPGPKVKEATEVKADSPDLKWRKHRPVSLGAAEPLSARGRERHMQEMAALGLPVDSHRSVVNNRARGRRVRHIAVAGGA
jgi:hypothetical protein